MFKKIKKYFQTNKKLKLALQETKEMFIFIAEKIIDNKDVLTNADQAIGDGDHGIGMARGFEAVKKKLEQSNFNTLGELLINNLKV